MQTKMIHLGFVSFLFENMRIILLESEFRGEIQWEIDLISGQRDFLVGDLPCPALSTTHDVRVEDGQGFSTAPRHFGRCTLQ